MKYIITLIALLIFYSVTSKEIVQLQNDSIYQKITKLDKQVNLIEKDFSNSVIQEYKDLNNLYAVGFGILIALFGLVFPTLLYFIQIKPAQDALKEAKLLLTKIEENFEQSFEEHLRKSKSKLIDNAIESYEKLDEQFLATAHINLETYKGEKFSKVQILRILSLLRRTDIESDHKDLFARLLTFQHENEIEKYFVDLISSDPKNGQCIWGVFYFAKNRSTEYYDLIADIVLNGYPLVGMISSISSNSKSFALGLLQNQKLVDNLQVGLIRSFCNHSEKNLGKKFSNDQLKETLLWRKYISTHDGLH